MAQHQIMQTEIYSYSDISEYCSSDASHLDNDYTPVKRPHESEENDCMNPSKKKCFADKHATSNQFASQSSCHPDAISNPVAKLLEELLQIVEPTEGQEYAMRRIVRELRCSLEAQQAQVENFSPNNLREELFAIGDDIYGATPSQRKCQIKNWMEEGTTDYFDALQKHVETTHVGQLLQCITGRKKVVQSNGEFETITTTQVHRQL